MHRTNLTDHLPNVLLQSHMFILAFLVSQKMVRARENLIKDTKEENDTAQSILY